MSKDFALMNDRHHWIHDRGLYSVHDLLARLAVLENKNRQSRDSIASAEKLKEQLARIIEGGKGVEQWWPMKQEWLSLHCLRHFHEQELMNSRIGPSANSRRPSKKKQQTRKQLTNERST